MLERLPSELPTNSIKLYNIIYTSCLNKLYGVIMLLNSQNIIHPP